MGGVSIRRVKPKDMPYVYEIEQLSFKQPYPSEYMNSLTHHTFLVAEKDGKIAGYIVAILQGVALGHIISIAVHPEYVRRGIGTTLILRLGEVLKEQGASAIRLEVRKGNLVAQKMYAKLGFKTSHSIKRYYENGEDCVVMLKAID